METEYRHCRQTRALLDYVTDHGRDSDVHYGDTPDRQLFLSARIIDSFHRDQKTERGRRAAVLHAMRERIRSARDS